MDLLQTEISKKRKAMCTALAGSNFTPTTSNSRSNSNSSTNTNNPITTKSSKKKKKKFVKNGDLRKSEQSEINRKETQQLKQKEERKRKRGEERRADEIAPPTTTTAAATAKSTAVSAPVVDDAENDTNTNTNNQPTKVRSQSMDAAFLTITPKEVTRRLRKMFQPTKLFGETEDDRKDRLHSAQKNFVHGGDDFKVVGQRNVFLDAQNDTNISESNNNNKNDSNNSNSNNEKKNEWEIDLDSADAKDDHKVIYSFFKGLLKDWENDLNNRDESDRRTAQGKIDVKTQKQCKDYIRPLFKLCKNRELEPTLTANLVKIVGFCRAGEFVRANDFYITIAIGNAAWPIGVTSVGIHARAGRERINDNKVAHVMNSELQRKYLTSVKRLMSFYQGKRSDVAPSKKVI